MSYVHGPTLPAPNANAAKGPEGTSIDLSFFVLQFSSELPDAFDMEMGNTSPNDEFADNQPEEGSVFAPAPNLDVTAQAAPSIDPLRTLAIPSAFEAPSSFDAVSDFEAPSFEVDAGESAQQGSETFDPLGVGFASATSDPNASMPPSFTSMFENLAHPPSSQQEDQGTKSRFGRKKKSDAAYEFAPAAKTKSKSAKVAKTKDEKPAKDGTKLGFGRKKSDGSMNDLLAVPASATLAPSALAPSALAPSALAALAPSALADTVSGLADPFVALVPSTSESKKKGRLVRSGSAPKAPGDAAESTGRFPRKFVIPAAMALVGVAGGGAYVAVRGGSTPGAAAVVASVAGGAATESASVESSLPGTPLSEAASDVELPPDLALADPLSEGNSGSDELAIEAPIQPITVVDEGDPTDPSVSGSANTSPDVATITTNSVAAPVSAGRFEVGSCVKVIGSVNDRTHRVSGASITPTDCAVAHNAEVVSTFNPEGDCERSVVSFVGYPEQITKVEGTVVAFSIVQDQADNSIYCVANFATMPDYTGQLFQSKKAP